MRLLGLSAAEAERRIKSTGKRLLGSMEKQLDQMVVAYALGRSVCAVGPASAGKGVLGRVFAAIAGLDNVDVSVSAGFGARELVGA
jgi:hypothetical protein